MATASLLQPVKSRFGELVATMSERDRKLFVFLIVFGVMVVLSGGWWLGGRYVKDLNSRIADRESTLGLLNGLAAEQENAAGQVVKIEDQLKKNAGQELSAFLEKAAQHTNISASLKGVRNKSTTVEGTLEEKLYTVELERVTVQQLTDFLYEMESSGYPLKVRSTHLKTLTAAGVKVLNVSMEVSAYRLIEAAAEETTDEEKAP